MAGDAQALSVTRGVEPCLTGVQGIHVHFQETHLISGIKAKSRMQPSGLQGESQLSFQITF